MSSIVQQRKLALLKGKFENHEDPKKSASSGLGAAKGKDSLNPGNNFKGVNENKGHNSPLMGRYQPPARDDTNGLKDSMIPGNEIKGVNESKVRNSPLLGRYQAPNKDDTNVIKDSKITGIELKGVNETKGRNSPLLGRYQAPNKDDTNTQKDSITSGKDLNCVNENKGRNSPLLGRYQVPAKEITNVIKDSVNSISTFGGSPSTDSGNKIKVISTENKSPNLGRNLNESKLTSYSDYTASEDKLRHASSVDNASTTNDSFKPLNLKVDKNVRNTSSLAGKDNHMQADNIQKQSGKDNIQKQVETDNIQKQVEKDNIQTQVEKDNMPSVQKIDVKPEEPKSMQFKPPEKKSDKRLDKQSRFAMRKQRRKRHRSDGYVLTLEMGNNSSEDEGITGDPSLGDAMNFLYWIRNPTLQNLAKLRRAIKTNDADWMIEFLEFDGLGLLFQCLKDLTTMQGFHLSDMVLKMECIVCIREVVNSQTGLDCLLKIKGKKDNIFGRRFASGKTIAHFQSQNNSQYGHCSYF